MLAKQNSSE